MSRILRKVAAVACLTVLIGTVAAQDTPKGKKTDAKKADVKKAEPKKAADATKEPAASGTLTFEIYTTEKGAFRWKLVNADGVTLGMCPKNYDTKAEAQKVVDAVKSLAGKATVKDSTSDKAK
jgi:uncharacterized protein YegP (UPF0339 family)